MSSDKKTPIKVAEGGYGCVYRPALECETQTENSPEITGENYVSKLMKRVHANKELREYSKIEKIDKANKYFLGMPTICRPKDTKTNKIAFRKCNILKYEKLKELENAHLLIMKDGGVSVGDFADKFPTGNSVNEKNKTSKASTKNKRIAEEFFVDAFRLFQAIVLFHEKGVIHHDLKPDNIVYDFEKRRIAIIDFGIMKNRKSMQRNFNLFIGYNFPPESIFAQIAKTKHAELFVGSSSPYLKYYTKVALQEHSEPLCKYLLFTSQLTKEYNNIYSTAMLNLNTIEDLNALKEECIQKIDVFGLGVALMYVLQRLNKFLNKKHAAQLFNCFYGMINPNVFLRYTPQQAIIAYESAILGILDKHHLKISDGEIIEVSKGKTVLNQTKKILKKIKSISKKDLYKKINTEPIELHELPK